VKNDALGFILSEVHIYCTGTSKKTTAAIFFDIPQLRHLASGRVAHLELSRQTARIRIISYENSLSAHSSELHIREPSVALLCCKICSSNSAVRRTAAAAAVEPMRRPVQLSDVSRHVGGLGRRPGASRPAVCRHVCVTDRFGGTSVQSCTGASNPPLWVGDQPPDLTLTIQVQEIS